METKDKLIEAFTSLMIEKINNLTQDYRTPWINIQGFKPRNINGRNYSAGNYFLLSFLCELRNYNFPIFLTFNQAKEKNIIVSKGEKSYPVYYYNRYFKHKITGENITSEKYMLLTPEAKNEFKKIMFLKYFNVFNIDQTNFADVYPEEYQKYQKEKENYKPQTNDFTCSEIDEMLSLNSWYCPIHIKASNRAFYSPAMDCITNPLKEQFPIGEDFYSTLLHEMAHSTGHKDRLDRNFAKTIMEKDLYAIEELTAELTSAIAGSLLDIAVGPREENAAYLNSWLSCLKEKPEYLFTILGAVSKATDLIMSKMNVKELEEEIN